MPATVRDDVDRELVELLAGDPGWVRRQFDDIVATEFPPDPPDSVAPAAPAAVDEPGPTPAARITGVEFHARRRRTTPARRGSQRSPPTSHQAR